MLTNELRQAQIRVDAGAWLGALTHNWNYIGYDEINYCSRRAGTAGQVYGVPGTAIPDWIGAAIGGIPPNL